MQDFKVGDKVIVVEPDAALLIGSVHVVHDIRENMGYTYVYLSESDKRVHKGWLASRFVKYEEKGKNMQENNKVANAVKVEMGKKYRRTGTHESVRIICTDREDTHIPCIGLYRGESGGEGVLYLDAYGKDPFDSSKAIEEIPVVDWSKVKVDAPIWIRDSHYLDLYKRHFNKFDGKFVYFWPCGTTSFSCEDPTLRLYTANPKNCFLEEPK